MIPFFDKRSVLKKRLGLVLRMRAMVYSSKDFESLWFLYQAEDLPKGPGGQVPVSRIIGVSNN